MSEEKKTSFQRLSEHADEIFEDIINGLKLKEIAEKYGVKSTQFYNFLASKEFSARAREAQLISADQYANMAEEILKNAERDGIEMQRARELAHHYRWMAGKRAPKKYGDSLKLDQTVTNVPVIIDMKNDDPNLPDSKTTGGE